MRSSPPDRGLVQVLKRMETFLPFLYASVIGTAMAIVGYFIARRAGLGPVQAEYVRTLEGNTRALNERIGLLEKSLLREKKARARLARRVLRLSSTVVDLAEENRYLRERLNMPRKSITIPTDDDDDDGDSVEALTDPAYPPDDEEGVA